MSKGFLCFFVNIIPGCLRGSYLPNAGAPKTCRPEKYQNIYFKETLGIEYDIDSNVRLHFCKKAPKKDDTISETIDRYGHGHIK